MTVIKFRDGLKNCVVEAFFTVVPISKARRGRFDYGRYKVKIWWRIFKAHGWIQKIK
jgi:hypothetical protein